MDLLWVVLAYLLGSLSFGRIVGAIKGINLAERDTPGASGTWRQFGPAWGCWWPWPIPPRGVWWPT